MFSQASAAPETALANWESLRGFYSGYGTVEDSFESGNTRGFVAEMFGQWHVICTAGPALFGVVNATDREAAIAFAKTRLLPQEAADDRYESAYP